jgi:ankyrin repeat protein
VKNQADIDTKHENRWTALHQAAFNGCEEAIRLLVEAKNEYGCTALHRAAVGARLTP